MNKTQTILLLYKNDGHLIPILYRCVIKDTLHQLNKKEIMSIVKNYVKIFIDKNYSLRYMNDVNLTQQSRLN